MNTLTHKPTSPRDKGLHGHFSPPPRAGEGVHQWIFNTALKLHRCHEPNLIYQLLRAATFDCGRVVPDREIIEAISNAARILKSHTHREIRGMDGKPAATSCWPCLDVCLRAQVYREELAHVGGLERSLIRTSPVPVGMEAPAETYVVPLMGDCLLCCGTTVSSFETKPLHEWIGSLSRQQFMVPSPMASKWGVTRSQGKPSMHTLSNTGARRFLVVEFDDAPGLTQIAILHHLAKFAPLVMILFSGGKSFHGWFYCEGCPEEKAKVFFNYAVQLGADPRTWARSQFVRVPGGTRLREGTAVKQSVHYFDPTNLNPRSLLKCSQ